jgi:hypothetical protein
MSILDIRAKTQKITSIVFAEDSEVKLLSNDSYFRISDDSSDSIDVRYEDIDNLILALRKAQEIRTGLP